MTKLLTKVIKGAFLIIIALTLHSCPSPDPIVVGPLWVRTNQSFDPLLFVNDIIYTDNQTIWASATSIPDIVPRPNLPVHVFRSIDGGKNWTDNIIPETNKLDGGVFPLDKNTAWLKIRGKGIYKTTNGGSEWALINSASYFTDPGITNSLKFYSTTEGVAFVFYDPDGTQNDTVGMIRTSDGGVSWRYVNLYSSITRQTGEMITTFHSIGDDLAMFTNKSRLILSMDRGNTWKAINCTPVGSDIANMVTINSSQKYAVNVVGFINNGTPSLYPNTKVLFTDNGGTSWTSTTIDLQMAWLYQVPDRENINIATAYKLEYEGGTYLSVDNCQTFESVDVHKVNIGVAAFYAIDNGVGASFNYNKDRTALNYFYRWDPDCIKDKIK